MPRLTRPEQMPREVRAVIDVIGNQARTRILHLLSAQPRTAAELAADLGADHSSVYRHLNRLEDAGLVQADHARGHRVGVVVMWAVDIDEVQRAALTWLAYATGHPDHADITPKS